jgi:hypothetical protein
MASVTPLSPTTLVREGVQRDVREASRQAKICLEAKDIDGSRAQLDKAGALLAAAREAWPNGWGEKQADRALADGCHPAEISISGLTVMALNLESTWWWETGDLPKAAQVLKPALSESGASNRQLAFTYSNMCAILSKVIVAQLARSPSSARSHYYSYFCHNCPYLPRVQLGQHDIAIKKARVAVKYCMDALKEATDAHDRARARHLQQQYRWRQTDENGGAGAGGAGAMKDGDAPAMGSDTPAPKTPPTGGRGDITTTKGSEENKILRREKTVQKTLLTLAVASHNLAVEVEFVQGRPCLKWYENAAEFARRASPSPSDDRVAALSSSADGSAGFASESHNRLTTVTSTSDSSNVSVLLRGLEQSLQQAQRKWADKKMHKSIGATTAAGHSENKCCNDNLEHKRKVSGGGRPKVIYVYTQSTKNTSTNNSRSKQASSSSSSGARAAAHHQTFGEMGGRRQEPATPPKTNEAREYQSFDYGDAVWRSSAPVGGPEAAEARRRRRARATTAAQRRREAAARSSECAIPSPRAAAGIPFVAKDAWPERPRRQARALRQKRFGPEYLFAEAERARLEAERHAAAAAVAALGGRVGGDDVGEKGSESGPPAGSPLQRSGGGRDMGRGRGNNNDSNGSSDHSARGLNEAGNPSFHLHGSTAAEQTEAFRSRLETLYGLSREQVEYQLAEFKTRMAEQQRRNGIGTGEGVGAKIKARHSNTRVKPPKLVEPMYGHGAYGLVPEWAKKRPWEAAPSFAYKRFHPFLEAKQLRQVRKDAGYKPCATKLQQQLDAANRYKEAILESRRKGQQEKPWRSKMVPPGMPNKFDDLFSRFSTRRRVGGDGLYEGFGTKERTGGKKAEDGENPEGGGLEYVDGDGVLLPTMMEIRARAAQALAVVLSAIRAVAAKMNKKVGTGLWFALFNEIDGDRTGRIDRDEFKVLVRKSLKLSSKKVSDEQVGYMFMAIEKDGDGTIEVGEFANFMDGKWLAEYGCGTNVSGTNSNANADANAATVPPPSPSQQGHGDKNSGLATKVDSNGGGHYAASASLRQQPPQPSMRRKLYSQHTNYAEPPAVPPAVGRPQTTGTIHDAGGTGSGCWSCAVRSRATTRSNYSNARGTITFIPEALSDGKGRKGNVDHGGSSPTGKHVRASGRRDVPQGELGYPLVAEEGPLVHLERRQLLLAYENAKADALSALHTRDLVEQIEDLPGNAAPDEKSAGSGNAADVAGHGGATAEKATGASAAAAAAEPRAAAASIRSPPGCAAMPPSSLSIMRRLQEAQNAAREQQGNDRSTVATRSVEGENVDDVEEGTYYDDEYEGFEPSYQGSGFVNEHDLANGLLEGLGSETGKVGLEEGARHLAGYDVEMEPPSLDENGAEGCSGLDYDQTSGMGQQEPYVYRPSDDDDMEDEQEEDIRRVNGLDLVEALQDQILDAMNASDVERAGGLNAQLAELEKELALR